MAAKKEQEINDEAQKIHQEKQEIIAEKKIKSKHWQKEDNSDNQSEEDEVRERDQMRYERKREIERDRRLEVAGKKKEKQVRDRERDVGEKLALGQGQGRSKENMFDYRLFNQSSGLDQGFGEEDDYNLYDKPLFKDKTAASIYRIGDGLSKEQERTKRAMRGFEGAGAGSERSQPIEFMKSGLGGDREQKVVGGL